MSKRNSESLTRLLYRTECTCHESCLVITFEILVDTSQPYESTIVGGKHNGRRLVASTAEKALVHHCKLLELAEQP